jgi:mycothiol system anti-sigma-R factor
MGSSEVGDCQAVLTYVWLYVDHEAPPTTCAELEQHLARCASCQRAVRFDTKFKQLVRRCADPGPISDRTVESLRLRVQAILEGPPPSQSAV